MCSTGYVPFATRILYETRPNDPVIFAFAGATLVIVALCAGYFAVRRISSIEPVTVLRRD